MNFKYKTSFKNEIFASQYINKNNLEISEASLSNLKDLIPKNIDFEKNVDFTGSRF